MANGLWQNLLTPVTNFERRLFPNDSTYQRVRRRRTLLCIIIGAPLLLLAVTAMMVKVSDSGGPSISQTAPDPFSKVRTGR
jgi:hypothetical protein